MAELTALLTEGTNLSLAWFIALCAVSFIGSLITAALGLGGGILVLAVMATVLPPSVLIPVHGVVQLGSNVGRAALLWRQILVRLLPWFVGGALIGAWLGGRVVVALPAALIQGALAIFILYATWAPRLRAASPRPWWFLPLGAISTFVSMFVGATGPLVAPFVSAASDDRRQVVATHASLMTIQHGFKVATFAALGFAFRDYVPLLIALLICGFAGTWVGRAVLVRIPETLFRRAFAILLTALAIRLLLTALGVV